MDEKPKVITTTKPTAKTNSPIRIIIGIVAGIILAIMYLSVNSVFQNNEYDSDFFVIIVLLPFVLSIGIPVFIVIYKDVSLSKTKENAHTLSLFLYYDEKLKDTPLTPNNKEDWIEYERLKERFLLLPQNKEFYQEKASRIPSGLVYYWLSIVFAFVGFIEFVGLSDFLYYTFPKENSLVFIGMLIPDLVYGIMLGLGIYKDTYLFN